MRHALMVSIFALVFCTVSAGAAEEMQAEEGVAVETAMTEDDESAGLKEIYTGEEDERPPETEYGVDRPNVMPSYEYYDEDTGLHDAVESDAVGDF